MYICLCKQITDKQIEDAIIEKDGDLEAIVDKLGVTTECGSCLECVRDMITEHYISPNNIPVITNSSNNNFNQKALFSTS